MLSTAPPPRPVPGARRRRVLRRPRRGTLLGRRLRRRRHPRHRHAAAAARRRPPPRAAGDKVVGYFTDWGVYDRNYHVKNIETSGSADKLTHINYAFGNVTGRQVRHRRRLRRLRQGRTPPTESVDGVADTWDQPLRGNFNQLRKLKKLHPDLKVIWSFGGWTWSGGFGEAAKNPAAFAQSCYDLVEDPRWADVFDGIDIDWEYPNACGLTCDTSGRDAFTERDGGAARQVRREQPGHRGDHRRRLRRRQDRRGRLRGRGQYVDWYNPMTYDYFGAWDAAGPDGPALPADLATAASRRRASTPTATIAKLKGLGVPASKLLLGIGFYGRGWTGVTQDAPGGTATGPAPGTYEAGIEDYKVLKTKCPADRHGRRHRLRQVRRATGGVTTPRRPSGGRWPTRTQQGLGGTFFWELSGDTTDGELIKAIN